MRILKDRVKEVLNTTVHGMLFELSPTKNEMGINYYDYDFDIGDVIEHDNQRYEILEKGQATPNIVGGRTWYVKVKQIEV